MNSPMQRRAVHGFGECDVFEKRRKYILLLVSALPAIAGALVSPLLPSLTRVFAAEPNVELLARFVFTLPGLFIALFAPLSGIVIDRYGRKLLLIASVILFAISGGSGLIAQSLPQLLFGRACLGIAVAAIMTVTTTLVGDYYREPERGHVAGTQAAFLALGGFLGLLISGLLAELSWRVPFFIYFLVLLLVPFVVKYISEPVSGNLGTHDKAFVEDRETPTSLSLILLVNGLAIVGMMIFFTVPIQVPFLLEEIGESAPSLAGLTVSVCILVTGISSMSFRYFKTVISLPLVLSLSMAIMAVGYLLVGISSGYWMLLVAMPICGLGMGLITPAITLWLLELSPMHIRGRVMSALASGIFFAQFVTPLISQPIISSLGLSGIFILSSLVLMTLAATLCFGSYLYQRRSLRAR